MISGAFKIDIQHTYKVSEMLEKAQQAPKQYMNENTCLKFKNSLKNLKSVPFLRTTNQSRNKNKSTKKGSEDHRKNTPYLTMSEYSKNEFLTLRSKRPSESILTKAITDLKSLRSNNNSKP